MFRKKYFIKISPKLEPSLPTVLCTVDACRCGKWRQSAVRGSLCSLHTPSTRYPGDSGGCTSTRRAVTRPCVSWPTATPSMCGTSTAGRPTWQWGRDNRMPSSPISSVPAFTRLSAPPFDQFVNHKSRSLSKGCFGLTNIFWMYTNNFILINDSLKLFISAANEVFNSKVISDIVDT